VHRALLTTLLLAATSLAANAGDGFDAAAFHQAKCTACHDSSVYTRPDRRVHSLARLESQVRMCDANLQTGLFDDDIKALAAYLNDQYYQLPR
jgi:cytochrome c553